MDCTLPIYSRVTSNIILITILEGLAALPAKWLNFATKSSRMKLPVSGLCGCHWELTFK